MEDLAPQILALEEGIHALQEGDDIEEEEEKKVRYCGLLSWFCVGNTLTRTSRPESSV